MKKREYNTPDGYKLLTQKQYLDEWDKFIGKLLSKLGPNIEIAGFDPSISLTVVIDGKYTNASVQIPVWFAKRIIMYKK